MKDLCRTILCAKFQHRSPCKIMRNCALFKKKRHFLMTWQLTRVTQKTRVHKSSPCGAPAITMCVFCVLGGIPQKDGFYSDFYTCIEIK